MYRRRKEFSKCQVEALLLFYFNFAYTLSVYVILKFTYVLKVL